MKKYILLPAYGRQVKSVQDTIADWEKGLDFRIYKGPYCSIRDMDSMKKEVDRIVFIVQNPINGLSMQFNYWIDPLSILVRTDYV